MRIFTAPTDLSADCTRVFLPGFLPVRRDATRRGEAATVCELATGGYRRQERRFCVDERRLSRRVASQRTSSLFLSPFRLSVRRPPAFPLSPSVANECRSADARRSGWFDEAWWMLLESRDSARLGACNEQNRGLNRQRAVRYSRRRRRRWREGRDSIQTNSPPYCIRGT